MTKDELLGWELNKIFVFHILYKKFLYKITCCRFDTNRFRWQLHFNSIVCSASDGDVNYFISFLEKGKIIPQELVEEFLIPLG